MSLYDVELVSVPEIN